MSSSLPWSCLALPFSQQSTYRKVRDRASYAFALVSVAAAVDIDGDNNQGPAPGIGWHRNQTLASLESWSSALKGQRASVASFRSAIDAELADAKPLSDNGFKIDLTRRTVLAVLSELTGVTA